MPDDKPITLSAAIQQIADQLDGPIEMEEFVKRVLAIRPSQAKKPADSIRDKMRWEQIGKSLVYLDRKTIVPLRIALQGIRFRLNLDEKETAQGIIPLESFMYFCHEKIKSEDLRFQDGNGHPVAAPIVPVDRKAEGLQLFLGPPTFQIHAINFSDWFRALKVKRNDSILVTILDWGTGHFRLDYEPASNRNKKEVEQQNQALVDLVFSMLEEAQDEQLWIRQAIPTAYVLLKDARGYPGDHWMKTLGGDSRIRIFDTYIRYAEARAPLDFIFGNDIEEISEEPFTKAQGQQIYRFKAALWHRPGLWRSIEIQGKQTLGNFDKMLRTAFQHDTSDHLGGFWKLIPRGKGKRVREVALGNIEPFGGGEGGDWHIAGLGLNPGEALKYVYDFGDWIEHKITLEEIAPPQVGVKYPQITGQNAPRYVACQECAAQEKQTRATWFCIDCSNKKGQDVVVCEKCLQKRHEDHYAEEKLY
ncbi:MAG: hypothetical protein EXR62_03925 [Chloroflexi bacterium]|nr:hypothetical protein [Chloroflexota bacterium]